MSKDKDDEVKIFTNGLRENVLQFFFFNLKNKKTN